MRIFRAEHAADVCECSHVRARHYADGGSTVWCDVRECSCRAYARREQVPV